VAERYHRELNAKAIANVLGFVPLGGGRHVHTYALVATVFVIAKALKPLDHLIIM